MPRPTSTWVPRPHSWRSITFNGKSVRHNHTRLTPSLQGNTVLKRTFTYLLPCLQWCLGTHSALEGQPSSYMPDTAHTHHTTTQRAGVRVPPFMSAPNSSCSPASWYHTARETAFWRPSLLRGMTSVKSLLRLGVRMIGMSVCFVLLRQNYRNIESLLRILKCSPSS